MQKRVDVNGSRRKGEFMRARQFLVLCSIVVLILAAVAAPAMAPDAVKASPDKYRVLFENEKVRLLEYRDKPGGVSPMHSHPAHLVYVINSGKRKFTFPDGKSVVAELKGGESMWFDAVEHAGENVGTADTHVLIFELKEQPR
jgi:quercetin dioxygenase-like cupin family protein